MNERIFELYKRAMVTVPANPGNKEFTWFDPEKFAVLLIRECAEVVDCAISDGGVDGRVLKQHFGVGE